ncbi:MULTISPECIES: hypothetical protein [Streptosporangium]|uniref:Uncharacterized protein n=1 Tax=Streptosporangium brasiliense TaxID=47480 RepID=A0ABT9RQ92_9ACTN|nr:hypothetical protein [Streptosporangium brasiliense]MDP9870455.1 hypothetical protein [Streptosporangium brasiliense]
MAGFDLVLILGLVVGPALSLVVGLVTKASWSGTTKGLLLTALSALDGFLVAWEQAAGAGQSFDWRTALLVAVGAFLAAQAAHDRVWKPSGLTAAAQGALVKDRVDLAA